MHNISFNKQASGSHHACVPGSCAYEGNSQAVLNTIASPYHSQTNVYYNFANTMKRSLLIILATLATVMSHACKCRMLAFSEEVAEADQIFLGTVLNKVIADRTYYLFTVEKTFKGKNNDTVMISTGLGGADCGAVFEVGTAYIIYSYNKQTTLCRRNALAESNDDLIKLRFLFDTNFSVDIGKTNNPLLTNSEAEYFNAELIRQRENFDFHGKKVALVLSGSVLGKHQYFKRWGGQTVVNNLILLTEEEKQRANGYDAIIVSWRKQGVSKGFRKKLVKRLM